MDKSKKTEVSVLSGEEGRFLEWTEKTREWKPFNYHNYRHVFEESTLVETDYAALRKAFKLEKSNISDEAIVKMSPDELEACVGKSA